MITQQFVLLCLASFGAGFIDSIVGGGGLLQLPALMLVFPQFPLVTLLGTNKLVSVTGTAFSAYRYAQFMVFSRKILLPGMAAAFLFSALGAHTVSILSNEVLKPIFMAFLFSMFIVTLRNQSFGMHDHDPHVHVPAWKPLAIGAVVGFYDGFFGPGTGSLLILAFVGILSMTFVQGSAYAKMMNLTTNVAALCFFIYRGTFLWQVALPMMVFNVAGAYLGVKLALLKGNTWVRGLLRTVIFLTILKISYEVVRDF